jgi:outer membrane cobalamin receptor
MFGKNPTSPYAPLSKQKIESISIVQGEKAVAMFGKKGINGVVIIYTKDGKPVPKKGNKIS